MLFVRCFRSPWILYIYLCAKTPRLVKIRANVESFVMHYLEITLFVEPRKSVGHFLNSSSFSALAVSIRQKRAVLMMCTLQMIQPLWIDISQSPPKHLQYHTARSFRQCYSYIILILVMSVNFYVRSYISLIWSLFTVLVSWQSLGKPVGQIVGN